MVVVAAIPAYNEEKTIATVILRAQKYVDRIIVCDDGSNDMTPEIAARLDADVIRHERRLGYGAAIHSLLKRSRELDADIMVTIDADGQHDPRDIPKLIDPIRRGAADIVIGSRFLDERSKSMVPRHRAIGIGAISRLTSASAKMKITDSQSGFRAYNRKSLASLTATDQGMAVSTELLMKGASRGLKIEEVPVNVSYEKTDTSSQPFFTHAIEVAVGTLRFISMRRPLLFYGLPGILFLMVSVVFAAMSIQIFRAEGRLVTNLALASIASGIAGLLCSFTAVILFALISVTREMAR